MSSENVQLTEIPAGLRKPGVYLEYNTRLANSNLPGNLQKMLIIAQRRAFSSVPALTPTRCLSDAAAADYFGAGSIAHKMVQVAIAENRYLDLTVCALDDNAAGVAATWGVTVSGLSTGPGTVDLYVGKQRLQVAVAGAGVAWEGVHDMLAAAVRDAADIPVTVVGNNQSLNLSVLNKGTVGNQIDLACIVNVPGMAVEVAKIADGSLDPDIAPALAAVYAGTYDKIVMPYTDETSLAALCDHINGVSGPLENRPACAVFADDSSLADATTLAGIVNDGRMVMGYLRGTRSPAYEIAAAIGSVWAGETDPARPFDGAQLTTVAAPPIDQRLSRSEQEACLANGVTPLAVGPGETVQIVRMITTYTKNALGINDPALLDATTITSLDYGRAAIRERIAQRFGRGKVTRKTPQAVRTQILDVMYKLQKLEIWDNVDQYKGQLIVEKDEQSVGQLNAKIPANVVPGFHVFAGVIDLIL
jgi:phage tail sheath gpL-like